MSKTLKDFVSEARGRISGIAPQDARDAAQANDVILDVREPEELAASGRINGALHVPRGMLESKADPDGDPRLRAMQGKGRIHVLCASGGRAAMAADTLTMMGYEATVIEGGMKGWKQADLPVES